MPKNPNFERMLKQFLKESEEKQATLQKREGRKQKKKRKNRREYKKN